MTLSSRNHQTIEHTPVPPKVRYNHDTREYDEAIDIIDTRRQRTGPTTVLNSARPGGANQMTMDHPVTSGGGTAMRMALLPANTAAGNGNRTSDMTDHQLLVPNQRNRHNRRKYWTPQAPGTTSQHSRIRPCTRLVRPHSATSLAHALISTSVPQIFRRSSPFGRVATVAAGHPG